MRVTFNNSSNLSTKQSNNTSSSSSTADIIPWGRAILTIYLVTSITYRFAFLPLYTVSFQYQGFVILDLFATIFFSYETIKLAKLTRSLLSPSTILPDTFEHPKDETNLSQSLRSYEDESEPQRRTLWSYGRVLFYFISTIPLEYLSVFFLSGVWTNYFLLNRLLRIFYLPKYLADLSTVLARKGYSNIGVRRTWLLFFWMAFAGHLCGCGFYYVARYQAENGVDLTWPEVAGVYSVVSTSIDGQSQVQVSMTSTPAGAYINSLYWAYITMITTGFGDIVPLHIAETIWCTISMFIGVLITALTIANLQRTIGQFDAARLNFQRKMELIKKFLHYRGLSKDVQDRVTSFYDYQWRTLKGADEEQFLTELPRTLQQQVTNFMCRDIIAALPLLRKANNALLNALVECSEMNIFSPNEDIVKAGEKVRGAILVSRGEVEVMRGGITERKMKRLDRFAQDSLFVDKTSIYNVRSKGFSEVILIPRESFQQVIKHQCDTEYIAQLKETACSVSNATKKANKMFGSGEDMTPTDGLKKYFHPNCFFRKLWDCLVLFGLIFYTFSIPLSFMHLLDSTTFSDTPTLLCLGYAVDLFFWIDAILEWNYFFYVEQSGLVVFDRDHIRQNYCQQNNLPREILCLVPFDIVTCFFGGRYCHFARLVKLIRLPNIAHHMESIEIMLAELKIDIDLSLYRVIKLNIVMITVCHWVGCLWYMMASLSVLLGKDENWRQADESNELFDISHADFGGFTAYLRSIYWAIVGMSTVGYGDIVPTNIIEMTFATVVILFGGLVLPAVVGGLAAYISNFHQTAKMFQKRIGKVRMYLLRISVGEDVLDKVAQYYDYHWTCQGGVVEQDVMDELPNSLQNAISSHISGPLLHSLPFLSRCDEATLQMVASVLIPRVFMPNDCIVKEGERGVEMYFVKSGEVVVTSSAISVPLRVLSKNDFFGESCLLGSSVSGATVKASTYCECLSLNRDDFQQVIAGCKQVKVDLANIVIQAKNKNSRSIRNFEKHPKCLRLTMEATSTDADTKAKSTTPAMFLPGSLFLLLWSSFLLSICIYNAWIIPFRLTFDTANDSIVIDWVFDTCFVLDVVLNYLFIAYVHNGELITDSTRIKRNYMATRFKMDMISTFPFDLVAYYLFPETPLIGEMLRLFKMFRLGRHFGTLEKLFLFLKDHHISLAGLRLVEFLSGVVLFAHWAACGFFLFARWKSSRAECEVLGCEWEGTWIQKQIEDGKLPIDGGATWQQYIRSFNWALPTLVVVVIGDVVPITSPETLYAFLLMAIGVTVNAAIVGNVANIVANLESDSSDFARRVDQIRSYMHKHHLSYDLHARVDDFTRYLWSAHGGNLSEDDFVLRLPYTLQTDVITQTRTRLLMNCPFFDYCTSDVVKALALCLKPSLFSPGEIICAAGDFGQSMFFLEQGKVQVFSDSKVLATLGSGSFFGETALFLKQPRSSSVCASSFCDIFELGKIDLFNEFRRRDIDCSEMLKLFAKIHDKNSRRNKAVHDNLSESRKDNTKLYKMIDSSDGTEEKTRAVLSIFMPGSNFRFCFDVICTALIVYFSVSVLFRLAFRPEDAVHHVSKFDTAVDLFFIIDMYLRATQFPFTKDGSVCTDKKAILERYMKSGMMIDGLACLAIFEAVASPDSILPIRLLSLLRAVRIPHFIKKINDHLALRGIRISLATSMLSKIILFYALTNHWVACVWFIIHRYMERDVKFTWATSDCPLDGDPGSDGCLSKWDETLGAHNVCNHPMINCYLRALHFSLTTLSTVGYGDISPVSELETIWENIVVLVGACFLAGLIGGFGAYLAESDTIGFNSFKEKITKLKQYLSYRHIPDDMQASILFFHHCRWKDSQTLDERETLSILPEPLQLDISFAVKQRVIRLVPILDTLPDIVQKRIAHCLILQVYSLRHHPTIYSQGDIGFEIYFIASGVVQIALPEDITELDETGRTNADANKQKFESIGLILGAGNHIGETCLCSKSGVRQETVVCRGLEKVELYVLQKDDLNDICGLMGPENGSKLKHALLSRNKSNWHSFDDIAGIDDWENEVASSTEHLTSRQNSLDKRSSFFPWATPTTGTRSTENRRRSSVSQPRRRFSSVSSDILQAQFAEQRNRLKQYEQQQSSDSDDSDSSSSSEIV